MGRPQAPGKECWGGVGEAIKDGTILDRPAAAQSTVEFLARIYIELGRQDPGDEAPVCGGPLLIHADGGFECTAGCPGCTKVIHIPGALHFCDDADRLGIRADELGQTCPGCTAVGQAEGLRMFVLCTGVEVDHEDGTTTCSLGDDCASPGNLHGAGITCGLLAPCERCGITAPLLG
ncbi:hypothetical protein ACWD48_36630 [Streptomyces sp. NPDC002519]